MVYVNEPARHAMMMEKKPDFPAGSIIVREKLRTEDSDMPALLSVMIKRERGFNPAEGDWEFLVADEPQGKLELLEKNINCMSCHGKQQESDYVFRNYLPEETRRNLK